MCELFEERGLAVFGILCRLLDKAEAEDVLVDVFASIWTEVPLAPRRVACSEFR